MKKEIIIRMFKIHMLGVPTKLSNLFDDLLDYFRIRNLAYLGFSSGRARYYFNDTGKLLYFSQFGTFYVNESCHNIFMEFEKTYNMGFSEIPHIMDTLLDNFRMKDWEYFTIVTILLYLGVDNLTYNNSHYYYYLMEEHNNLKNVELEYKQSLISKN